MEDIKKKLSQSPQLLEEKVLRAIFKKNSVILDCINIINENYFTINDYATIYKAMVEIYKKENTINCENVILWLEQNGYSVDDKVIKRLYNESYTAIKIKDTCENLKELYIRRSMLEGMHNILDKQEQNPTTSNEILDEINNIALKSNDLVANNNVNTKGFEDTNNILTEIDLKLSNKVQSQGLLTGISVIDNDLRGLLGGKLWCIVADSQVGKSQMAIEIITNALLLNKNINAYYYSLEMTKKEVEERSLAVVTGIEPRFITEPKKYFNIFDVKTNTLRNIYEENPNAEMVLEYKRKIKEGVERLNKVNFYIDDTPDLNTEALLARIQKNHLKNGKTDIIVVDHINILCSGTPSEEVGLLKEAYNRLKQIAKKLDCTVIVLHQFSKKELASDPLHKPSIFALTGGSAPRHFADIIMGIWRPCVYRDVMDAHPELKDHCDIDFQKVRYTSKPDVTPMTYNGYVFKEKILTEVEKHALENEICIDEDGNIIEV